MTDRNDANFGRLIVRGADRPGIVATVSTALSELGANIVSLDQSSSDPSGGRFFQRTVFHLADLSVKLDGLREALRLKLGTELGLDFRLVEAWRKKRVAIFVSKADHCLLDLLWRQRRGDCDMAVPMVVSNHPDLRDDVRPFSDAAARQGHVTIFHFALPSPMTEAFAGLGGLRVLQYHNITPAAFFAPYDAQLFRLAALGRQELRSLAGRVDLALGDSEFNRQELEGLGFDRTGVMPIAVNTGRLTAAPRRPALEKVLGDGLINFLFVGRIVPNKRIEDHIRLAEMYKRYIDSYYRFIFVGRYDGLPRYYAMVRALIVQYRMLPERFIFTGGVPDDDLAAYYRWADAYISLSDT